MSKYKVDDWGSMKYTANEYTPRKSETFLFIQIHFY